MQLRLLGPLELIGRDGPLPIAATKERTLLALLAVRVGQPVSEATLMEALWAAAPPRTAVKTLHSYISRLRRILADGGLHPALTIATLPGAYRLDASPGLIDVERVDELVDQARQAAQAGDAGWAAVALAEAQRSFRGRPLGELADEPWAQIEAARLSELAIVVTEERIDADLACGRHLAVAAELEALCAAHPLRERLWCLRMLALYRGGRQAEALRAAHDLRTRLVEEMGIEPGEEVRSLEQAILAHDPDLAWPTGSERPPSALPAGGLPSGIVTLPSTEIVGAAASLRRTLPPALAGREPGSIVGRAEEQRRLHRRWQAAREGQRQALLLGGEPGIGKTTLVAGFAASCSREGALVLYGRCDEDLGGSYQPFVEALTTYVAGCAVGELRSHVTRHGGALGRLVPELGRRLPALPSGDSVDPEAERLVLFDSVVDLLAGAAERAPVLLVLEDLQWAKRPTLALLAHLLRDSRPMAVIVVATYRDTELGRSHPLAEVLADLRRERAVERLALGGLDVDGVTALVALRVADGDPVDAVTATALQRQTQGNPFFLTEMLRHLADPTVDPDQDLPEGITEVISRRLSRLSADTNTVLTLAAVAGAEVPVQLLERLVEGSLTNDALLDALDEAVAARIIQEVPAAPGRYEFTHALIRRTVYAELGTARRMRLHRLVGEALEVMPAHQRSTDELARHFTEAAHDGPKAARYGLEAAQEAVAGLAFEEAIADAERALAVLDLHRSDDDRLRCELLLVLTDAHTLLLDVARARRRAVDAAAAGRRVGDPELLMRVGLSALGALHTTQLSNDPEILVLVQDVLAAMGSQHPDLRARLLAASAYYRAIPEAQRVEPEAIEAVALARETGDVPALLTALEAMCIVLDSTGRAGERLVVADELVTAATAAQDRLASASGHFWRATGRLAVGDRDGCEADLGALAELAERLRSGTTAVRVALLRVCLALLDGRWDEAAACSDEVLRGGEDTPAFVQAWGGQLFMRCYEQGSLAEVAPLLADLTDQEETLSVFEAVMGLTHLELGDDGAARHCLRRLAEGGFAGLLADNSRALALMPLAELCARLGDGASAEVLLGHYGPYEGTLLTTAGTLCLGAADRYLGMLELAAGRPGSALPRFESALGLEAAVGSEPLQARTRRWWAEALLRRGEGGDEAAAAILLDTSLSAAAKLGMAGVEADARARLATLR